MFDVLNFSLEDLQVFILVLVRVSSLFVVAPLLGAKTIDNRIKAAASLIMAVIMLHTVDRTGFAAVDNFFLLTPYILREFMTGIVIGFAAGFIFYSLQFSGHMIGRQMGIAMANVFDPETEEQVPVIGQYFTLFATILFLLIDGHHWLIRAFMESYKAVPLAGLKFTDLFYDKIIILSSDIFVIGVKVAAPVFVSLLMLTLIMGVLARAVASMNIFAVGFPIKILGGMVMLLIFVEIYADIFLKVFTSFQHDIETLISVMA